MHSELKNDDFMLLQRHKTSEKLLVGFVVSKRRQIHPLRITRNYFPEVLRIVNNKPKKETLQ